MAGIRLFSHESKGHGLSTASVKDRRLGGARTPSAAEPGALALHEGITVGTAANEAEDPGDAEVDLVVRARDRALDTARDLDR